MTSGGTTIHSFSRHLERWLDECKMALSGIVLATREWKFLVAFAISFIIFGTLMNLLSGSTAALNYFWMTDFFGKLKIIGEGFLAIFGIGRNFWDWIFTFFIVILQSILIGLVVLVWQKRRRHREQIAASVKNASNVQDAGLVAGLAILGSGCPTCGTTLLAPALSAFFSSGSYFLAGLVSGVLTVAAVLLSLFALKRIGKDAYIMITSERYRKRHANVSQKEEKINE